MTAALRDCRLPVNLSFLAVFIGALASASSAIPRSQAVQFVLLSERKLITKKILL
ncbi:uncharacterized protein BJX67DRAFT_364610 [Aspergillus lucknowensis]|uniref:Uncharacterized protein n=1 Tax=Aspergillus lucknowensis TaxID=176173 RepID=A0ABR4LER7_9EURO